ncbi:MAG TPA: hypothetical protein DCX09_02075, partial [Gammaproteobacteria bacterium]|nr:hypothetical protein [Gammaproteobacteria bacterium]
MKSFQENHFASFGTRSLTSTLIYCGLLTLASVSHAQEWTYWGGNKAFNRYSPADHIDAGNVQQLEIVWQRSAIDESITSAFPRLRVSGTLRGTPIYLDGVLYASN